MKITNENYPIKETVRRKKNLESDWVLEEPRNEITARSSFCLAMLDYAEINGKEIDAQVLRTLGCGIGCAREAVKTDLENFDKRSTKKRQIKKGSSQF